MGMKFAPLLLAASLALASNACGGSAVPVPEGPPPRVVEPSTRVDSTTHELDEPAPLIAPPPAYGNKIVMTAGVCPSDTF